MFEPAAARIGFVRLIGLGLVVLSAMSPESWGSTYDLVGIVDGKGLFQPKARITKNDSSIVVRKTNPHAKYDSVRIRFILPGIDGPEAGKDLFIQWEKKPGKWGRLWPLAIHKGFKRHSNVFTATWNASRSFMILDRSAEKRFHKLPWDRIVQIWIDGKSLANKRAAPVLATVTDSPGQPAKSEAKIPPMPGPTTVARRPAAPIPVPSIDRSAQRSLEKKYLELSERMIKLESTVETARERYFWAPLVALALSILFSTVAIFLAFIRLSRDRAPGMPSSPRSMKLKFRPDGGFRKTG